MKSYLFVMTKVYPNWTQSKLQKKVINNFHEQTPFALLPNKKNKNNCHHMLINIYFLNL